MRLTTGLAMGGLGFIWLAGIPDLAAQGVRTVDQGTLIGEEAIRRTGARTAWEVLQRVAQPLRLQEGSRGQPARILNRGLSTVALGEGPLLYVDGVRLADFRTLATIPAGDIASVQILSGIDGTTRYGSGAVSGVILIRTKIPARAPKR